MSSLRRLIFWAFLCAAVGGASAPASTAPVDASVAVHPGSILVGEPVEVRLTLRWQPPLRVHPLSVPPLGPAWEVLDGPSASADRAGKDGRRERTVRMRLTAYEVGALELPAFEVAVSSGTQALESVRTAPCRVEVRSALKSADGASSGSAGMADPDAALAAQLRPIKPPQALPFDRRLLWVAWGAVALLAAGGLLLAVLWRRLRARRHPSSPPPLPAAPEDEALQALARLELEDAANRETARVFYDALSIILRRYLGRRYGFDALEMTSGELETRLEGTGWGADLHSALIADGRESDSVKFARYVPPPPLRLEALERVKRIVLESRPLPSACGENGGPVPAGEGETGGV